jgi:hypothetical protein
MTIRVIQNFGMFWERESIAWGARGSGNSGHLQGYAYADQSTLVDFREQRGIYVLYEGADIVSQRVSYVGQAGRGQHNLFHRLRHHRDDHLWNRWQRFSWFGFLAVGAKGSLVHKAKAALGKIEVGSALDQMEAVTMVLLEPLLNKQGPRWHGATQYFQHREEES